MSKKTRAERGVGFVLRRHPDNSLEKFLEEVQRRDAHRRRESLPRTRTLAQSPGPATQAALLDRRCRRRRAFRASSVATTSCSSTCARTSKQALPKFLVAPQESQAASTHGTNRSRSPAILSPTTSPPASRTSIAPSARRHLHRRNARRAQAPARLRRPRPQRLRRRSATIPKSKAPAVSRPIFTSATSAPSPSRLPSKRPVAKGKASRQRPRSLSRPGHRLARTLRPLRQVQPELRQLGMRRALGAQDPRRARRAIRAPAATPSTNSNAPKPTTTSGTPPSARWSRPAGCTTTCACTGPR